MPVNPQRERGHGRHRGGAGRQFQPKLPGSPSDGSGIPRMQNQPRAHPYGGFVGQDRVLTHPFMKGFHLLQGQSLEPCPQDHAAGSHDEASPHQITTHWRDNQQTGAGSVRGDAKRGVQQQSKNDARRHARHENRQAGLSLMGRVQPFEREPSHPQPTHPGVIIQGHVGRQCLQWVRHPLASKKARQQAHGDRTGASAGPPQQHKTMK